MDVEVRVPRYEQDGIETYPRCDPRIGHGRHPDYAEQGAIPAVDIVVGFTGPVGVCPALHPNSTLGVHMDGDNAR